MYIYTVFSHSLPPSLFLSVSTAGGLIAAVVVIGTTAANVAHIRQSKPDSGRGSQVKVLNTLKVVPSSLGSGLTKRRRAASGHICPNESGLFITRKIPSTN